MERVSEYRFGNLWVVLPEARWGPSASRNRSTAPPVEVAEVIRVCEGVFCNLQRRARRPLKTVNLCEHRLFGLHSQ